MFMLSVHQCMHESSRKLMCGSIRARLNPGDDLYCRCFLRFFLLEDNSNENSMLSVDGCLDLMLSNLLIKSKIKL